MKRAVALAAVLLFALVAVALSADSSKHKAVDHSRRKRGHPTLHSELYLRSMKLSSRKPPEDDGDDDILAPGKHPMQGQNRTRRSSKRRSVTAPNGIGFQGGSVMPVHKIYIIWYGKGWAGTNGSYARTMMENLARTIPSSRWWTVATTYTDNRRRALRVNTGVFGGSYFDTTYTSNTNGPVLDDDKVWSIISTALIKRKLPLDPTGVYMIMPSKEVTEVAGACSAYCAYHSADSVNGVPIKYSFVNNPIQCPSACIKARSGTPNQDPILDAMASMFAHELVEAVTDPLMDGWRNEDYTENADMCSWNFGTTQKSADGSSYNLQLGTRRYLIQQNWVNARGGYCAMEYP